MRLPKGICRTAHEGSGPGVQTHPNRLIGTIMAPLRRTRQSRSTSALLNVSQRSYLRSEGAHKIVGGSLNSGSETLPFSRTSLR